VRTQLRTAAAFVAGAALTALVFAFHPEPGEAIRNIAHPPAVEPEQPDLYNIVRVERDDGGFDHVLGPHVSIDRKWVTHSLSFEGPKVRILVGADGRVAFAQTRSGPKDTQREAERLVRQVRFIPFQRDGKPVPAVIEEFQLRVRHQPEQRADYRKPFPVVKDWSTLSITHEHMTDRGGDRRRLTIDGHGRVIFEGDEAAVRGKHVATISKQDLEALVDAFRRADWFSTLDQYSSGATHQDIAVTQIQFDGHHKPVRYSPSSTGYQPDAVRDVHSAILRITNADRWLKGNAETGPSLVAEKWDFNAKTPENLSLLTGIAARGDIRALKDVWALGAPVIANTGPYPAPIPAIVPAAARSDIELLRHLLSLDALWDQAALDAALLNAAGAGKAEAVDWLLSRGANPRAATTLEGASALMLAARAGSRGAVAALIAKASSRDAWSYESLFSTDDFWPERDAKEEARLAEAAKRFVTHHGRDGVTALHALADAWTWGKTDVDTRGIARLLIKHGAVVDARDANGRTPLIEAGGCPEVASELISAGADVNARDNTGQTPLMNSYAPWLTYLLLRRGADIEARDTEGRSALDRSKEYGGSDTTPVLEWWLAKTKPSHP
jgi:ankyrin repeat protein